MGKGVIVAGGTDGNYTIKIEFDRRRVDAKIAAIDARLGSDLEVTQALAALLQAENELNALLAELDQTINGWEALQNWLSGTDYPRGIVDGNQVLIQIGVSAVVAQPGRSGSVEPDWASINHGDTLRENEVVWSMSIRDPEGGAFWSPSTDYAVDDEVLAKSNLIIEMEVKNVYATATKAGRSGFSVPTWPNSGSVIEGGIIWQKRDQIPSLSELVLRVGTASQARDTARDKYDTVRLEREELRREKAYLEAHMPEDPEVQAWCADVTENFAVDDEVGTMEIPGERNGVPVLVRPGHVDESQVMPGAVYDHIRDGQIQPSVASTAPGVFWNLAILPAWQRWRPQYRIGAIVSIDYEQGQCSVQIEAATSSQQDLNVNDPGAIPLLFDVPVRYMTCNAAAFTDGDRVIVEFEDHDWEKPRVIGFESNPKRCPVGQFTFIYNTGPFLNDDRLFRGAPGNWQEFDLEDGQATILNTTTQQSIWTSNDKKIILTASPNFNIHQGVDKVATTPNIVLAAGLNTHNDDTVWLRSVMFSGPDVLAYEKPWPVFDALDTAIFNQSTYDALIAAEDVDGALLEWQKWHLIGQSVITDLTGGPNPGVLRLGSMNSNGDEAAIMLGFIFPETHIDQFGGETASEWHGYIKIDLDGYSVDVFEQSLTISAEWDGLNSETSNPIQSGITGFDPGPGAGPGACAAQNGNSSSDHSHDKTESQIATCILDVAYDGNNLLVGEIDINYSFVESNSDALSSNINMSFTPVFADESETEVVFCQIAQRTNSVVSNARDSIQITGQTVVRIRQESGGGAVLEKTIEDYSIALALNASYNETFINTQQNINNQYTSAAGESVFSLNVSGKFGVIEYFSVLHRAVIIRQHDRTQDVSTTSIREIYDVNEFAQATRWVQTAHSDVRNDINDLITIVVPGNEQELSDPIVAENPIGLPTGALGGLVPFGGELFFTPEGDPLPSYGGSITVDRDTLPGFTVLASFFKSELKNALDWSGQVSLDVNCRYFNGSTLYSIYKLDPEVWPVAGPDPDRFDTSVRYTYLTGGDPAGLLEAEGDVILQQIGIL